MMKATTSLSLEDLEAMSCAPPPARLSRGVTATRDLTFSAKNFVTTHRVETGTISELYEFREMLGSGGYGEVYACIHKQTGIERAVKILEKSKYCDEANEEIVKEFNILKEMDHPNILRQVEMLFDEKHYYIVTEICRGGELFDEIQQWGNFVEEDAAELMRHVLGAIKYCHKQNIVHRDLKPENILLEENKDLDSIKIIDFGLSKFVEQDTVLNDLVGSIYYIAPEVFQGAHGMKADIWSCGVIAYILISGFAPFDGHSDDDIKEDILTGDVTFDDEVWDNVSDQAKDFITTLLEFDPQYRPSAEEALLHPWIQENRMAAAERLKKRESANERAIEALHNLERFNAQSKLKQATCAFIASQLVLKEEKKKIDELFRALDIHNNGKLTKDDVRIGYKEVFGHELSKETVEAMFQRIDYDNTGYIEYSEFVIATMNEKDLLSNDKLKHAFDMFDADGSGEISCDELVDVMSYFKSVDKSLDPDAINCIIKQIDQNDDGQINFDEFTAMMMKTAEDAILQEEEEEKSNRERNDPIVPEPVPPTTTTSSKPQPADEPATTTTTDESATTNPEPTTKRKSSAVRGGRDSTKKSPTQRISGAMGTKACLALFESNIQKNKEYDDGLLNPIARLSARISYGRAKKRASQETVKRMSTPVVKRTHQNTTTTATSNGGDPDSALDHSARARASQFEELIRKNQPTDANGSPPPPVPAQS